MFDADAVNFLLGLRSVNAAHIIAMNLSTSHLKNTSNVQLQRCGPP